MKKGTAIKHKSIDYQWANAKMTTVSVSQGKIECREKIEGKRHKQP
jgi:hypothetical protein